MDILLNVTAGPLRRCWIMWRQGVWWAGWGHLHVAELAQKIIVLENKNQNFLTSLDFREHHTETKYVKQKIRKQDCNCNRRVYISHFHSSPHRLQTWLAGRAWAWGESVGEYHSRRLCQRKDAALKGHSLPSLHSQCAWRGPVTEN